MDNNDRYDSVLLEFGCSIMLQTGVTLRMGRSGDDGFHACSTRTAAIPGLNGLTYGTLADWTAAVTSATPLNNRLRTRER